jgi:hypothetical protein
LKQIKGLARDCARACRGGGKNKEDRIAETAQDYLAKLYFMPKKGKLSAPDKERQSQKPWRKLANRHSAVESNINSLEHHGLNRCPDKGYQAYARYAGLGVLAYNLHKIGNHLLEVRREADRAARAA